MEQIMNLLAKADSQLEQISVKGADAYLMVNARSLLKAAFDSLNAQPSEPSEKEDDDG